MSKSSYFPRFFAQRSIPGSSEGRFEITTRVCLPDPIHLKVARREFSWLKREVGVAQRLVAEVVQAVLVVRESALAGAVRELPVQVEQTVLLVVQRHRERPVVGSLSAPIRPASRIPSCTTTRPPPRKRLPRGARTPPLPFPPPAPESRGKTAANRHPTGLHA